MNQNGSDLHLLHSYGTY